MTSIEARSSAPVRSNRDVLAYRPTSNQSPKIFPSHANFIFAELPADVSGRGLRDPLQTEHELMVREFSNKLGSTGQFMRLDVTLPVEIERLAVALDFRLDQTIVPDNAKQASHTI